MYGEASLGGDWYPARFQEITKTLVRATIIGSKKARIQNIIGIDLSIGKDRVTLMEEPRQLQRLEDWSAYGVQIGNKKRHSRHVSAVPDEDTLLPIEAITLFPGIAEEQIDILDFCLKKYLHRFGKLDATWNEVQADDEFDIKAYTQNVDSSVKRIMVRAKIAAPHFILARLLAERTAGFDHENEEAYKLEVLKEYGSNMKIIRRVTNPEYYKSITASREVIAYDWRFFCEGTSYSLRCSLEEDDPTGLGKIDGDSPHVRATFHPGTGFTYTPIAKYETELVMMLHMDPGGWLPTGPLIKQMTTQMMAQAKDLTIDAIEEFDDDRSTEDES